ncbi:DUF1657 domain-containing protein [Iocasia frigidifontis]|uniref:DUF1657 domain-containing protein n=1 Tax=Iocasia fonsfrigidae TaxID=2682810 RepID=A0A8A7KM52_9FIRM|nr:DUF1657 domain-containing protein [Iocasia fonsfrigidae]QTL98912.1 DUF1657 domain-containing protein [Iocasia fonsfrigidae]
MSVGKQLHQTLASLRSAKTDMETYALSTEDKDAQKLYADCENQLENMINSFAGRVNYVEEQEPQYNVKKQMQENNQQKS